ncbi:MAG: hypothetical protein ABI778_01055 [Ignavibacteriota bacterium]
MKKMNGVILSGENNRNAFLSRRIIILLCFFCTISSVSAQPVTSILQSTSFGVPSSPAFELLPGAVSQTVNLITPHDVQANILSLYDNGHLRTGAAFDARPFAGFATSLKAYQKDPLQQVAWRTVASIGTAPAGDKSSDVLLAAGLRIPILDFGDPRSDAGYIATIEKTFTQYLRNHPLPGDASDEDRTARLVAASDSTQAVRSAFIRDSWNALKLDAGVGILARSIGGSFTHVLSDRAGFWLALGLPVTSAAQLSLSAKLTSWIRTDSANTEATHTLFGASARIFPAEWISATIEGSRNESRYLAESSNENWWHFAIACEMKVPILNGWIGFGYGTDTPHTSLEVRGVSFHYTYYRDAELKK